MSSQGIELKAVLYADGGHHSSHGTGGWGIHGYTFQEVPPKKGTGNPKAVPTHNGYSADPSVKANVTVVNYVEGVGGVWPANSSNQTELTAAKQAMQWALTADDIKEVKVFTDSKYVTRGINEWLDKWKNTGWRNGQGDEVSNKDLWLTVDELKQQLEQAGKVVKFEWIKGHDGHFGNEMADAYARRGNILGIKNDPFTFLRTKDASGYWSNKVTYNRLLDNGRWYFSTIDTDYVCAHGHIYYIGDCPDDEQHGKPTTDSCLAVVILKQPEAPLELIRSKAMELDTRKYGHVLLGRLDTLLNPKVLAELDEHGTTFLDWRTPRRLDMMTSQRRPVVKEMSPPGLVYLAVDGLRMLEKKLLDVLNETSKACLTDITDLFFDSVEKKGGTERKLKKDFTQNVKYFDVAINYRTTKESEVTEDTPCQTKKARLIVGLDMPKRNMLSNVAPEVKRVVVISWRESDKAIRYATIVETLSGTGIWAGIDANILIV